MEKKSNKQFLIIIWLLIIAMYLLIGILWYIDKNNKEFDEHIHDNPVSGSLLDESQNKSGIIITDLGNDLADTGNSKEITDKDLFMLYKSSNRFVSYTPMAQGTTKGSYAENSNFMINYLTKNTFQFNLPYQPKNGYLYIKFKKPTTNTVFAYWYNTKINGYTVSGDLDSDGSLIESDSELLYKLDSIPYTPYHQTGIKTFDWISKLKKGNQNFIAGFLRVYDGSNQIEEITIAWE